MYHPRMIYRRPYLWLLCLLILGTPSCGYLTPQQQNAAKQTIQAEYEAGRLTASQRDVAFEAIDKQTASAGDVSSWLYLGGSVLASILLGVPISVGAVQAKRGPSATPQERATRMVAKAAKA
jgi:hypothetical protein